MQNKFIHSVVAVLLFAIPVILQSHSGVLDLTVGGLLNAIYLYISQLYKPTVAATAPLK
jgi:hypothetical protein